MALASFAVRTTNAGNAAAVWEIRTSSARKATLLELGFFCNAATASVYGLGTPAAIGVTPTSPQDFLPEDPSFVFATGTVQSALAWATGPTVPANFFRRWSGPATIGAGVIWTFPKGIAIAVSSSIILWGFATSSVVDAYAVLDV